EPPGQRDAGSLHHLLGVESRLEPIVVDLPDATPMPPRAFEQAVIEWQRDDIEPHIGRALHVVMAAENIGAHAAATHVAGGEQQYAARPHVRRTHGVLS